MTGHGLISDPVKFQKWGRIGLIARFKLFVKNVMYGQSIITAMTKSPLKLVAPATVNRTVTTPRRKRNAEYRTREHLTGAEVDRLIDAAKRNRWGHRLVERRCRGQAGLQGSPPHAAPRLWRWPTRATIRERCRLTSVTATSSTRCDTPSCHRAGSRIFGGKP